MVGSLAPAVKPREVNGAAGRSEICAIPPPMQSRFRPLRVQLAAVLISIVGLSVSTAAAQSQRAGMAGRNWMLGASFIQRPSGPEEFPRARAAHPRPASAIAEPTVRRVPGVYPSIQSAIDASYDGDTVLVSEGTYYENIRYHGKSITVGSKYLIDGDTSHIEGTIIDGSRPLHPDSASVVYFLDGEDTTSVLIGVTVTGGGGTRYDIMEGPARMCGGVCFGASGGRLIRNLITRNRVNGTFAAGGGVGTLFPPSAVAHLVILEGNRISDNCAWGESQFFSGFGGGWGGGACFHNSTLRLSGNVFERDTAGGGPWTGGGGLGIRGYDGVFPGGKIVGNLFRGNVCREVVNAGQVDACGAGLLLGFTGEVSITENLFEGNITTCQYGWADGGGVMVSDWDTTGYGRKHILRNRFVGNRSYTDCARTDIIASGGGLELHKTLATVSGNSFTGNTALGRNGADGGGLCIFNSSFVVGGNMFAQNSSSAFGAATGNGGGMSIGSPPQEGVEQVIANNIFVGNSCGLAGGALSTWEWPPAGTPVRVVNNTIFGNRARTQGGGIVVWTDMNLLLMNNIVWDNLARELPDQISNVPIAACIVCNDIQGGWAGEGNIEADPRFVGDDYALSDSSLCIGAGKDSAAIGGATFNAPTTDFSGRFRPDPPGSMPDIGATENPLPLPLGSTALRLLPPSIDFGNVPRGDSSDVHEITLTNRSSIPYDMLSLSISRPEFMLSHQPTLPLGIAPLGTVRLGIRFRPVHPGVSVIDTLTVTTTDTLFGRGLVKLSGRGSDSVRSARPGVLYAVSASSDGMRLFTLDRPSGRGELAARYSPPLPAAVSAIAIRPGENMICGALPLVAGTDLYRLSVQMGDWEREQTLPIQGVISMAFSPWRELFLVTAGGDLHRVLIGQAPVHVGATGHSFTGLAFNPVTTALWGTVQDSIFTVDPASGEAHLVGVSGWQAPRSLIAFAPVGTLYGVFGGNLVTVGTVWGEPTVIGPTGVADLVGLAMRCDMASELTEGIAPPLAWRLEQNYPNPFNSATIIRYELPEGADVRLAVFDCLGREVATLVGERKAPGTHAVEFSAPGLASGVYFCRLTAGARMETRKMVILR